jgi:hypothetical protein
MTTKPDSIAAANLLRDVSAAHDRTYHTRKGFDVIAFLGELHKRGLALTREGMVAEVAMEAVIDEFGVQQ